MKPQPITIEAAFRLMDYLKNAEALGFTLHVDVLDPNKHPRPKQVRKAKIVKAVSPATTALPSETLTSALMELEQTNLHASLTVS